MKRIIILLLSIVTFSVGLSAQESISNQRVEVIKNYTPEVDKATKLMPMPNMVDTVKLYPESEYEIFPSPWQTSFGVEPYEPAKVNAGGVEPTTPFYAKVGGGFAANSVLDFYASDSWVDGFVVGYLNHKGNYAKVDNRDATQVLNNIGVNYNQAVFTNKLFTAKADYIYDFYSRYGDYGLTNDTATGLNQSTVKAKLSFGDDFMNETKFNYALGVEGGVFADNYLEQSFVDANLRLGYGFGNHRLGLNLGFEGDFMPKGDYSNTTVSVQPRYGIKLSKYTLDAGIDLDFDNQNKDSKAYVFPYLKMTYDPASGFILPYLELSGEIVKGDYHSLIEQNPYTLSGYTIDNSSLYSAKLGLSGNFSKRYSYNAYVGLDLYSDLVNFVSDYYAKGSFTSFSDDGSCFYLGAYLQTKISRALIMSLEANYYAYDLRDWNKVGSRASFELDYFVRYAWGDKFFVRADVNLLGTRYFYQTDSSGLLSTVRKGACVNIDLGIDYRLNDMLIIFVEGTNLANAELYPYGYYKGYGMGVSLGAKIVF